MRAIKSVHFDITPFSVEDPQAREAGCSVWLSQAQDVNAYVKFLSDALGSNVRVLSPSFGYSSLHITF